ncbi:uncharacterized protein BP01DRAFT_149249 [Aspergillus saccharolyticus JOP 1030-1]|uniref:Uncharacterized protein n=1 Tax=Aspergillus saccharolyticus JOP 1030-1 TaxID=1450539 RepID=A0A318ZLL8_9EURO|nr:hypothetical protein BP01DRAFT_149249 [Aspergillus saccharolyticus JOP 1030-1]PYH48489.1 hypothetical protein BP01DRAFT_149249 [Aspergillus saccharolyticus JOP 1030-1]
MCMCCCWRAEGERSTLAWARSVCTLGGRVWHLERSCLNIFSVSMTVVTWLLFGFKGVVGDKGSRYLGGVRGDLYAIAMRIEGLHCLLGHYWHLYRGQCGTRLRQIDWFFCPPLLAKREKYLKWQLLRSSWQLGRSKMMDQVAYILHCISPILHKPQQNVNTAATRTRTRKRKKRRENASLPGSLRGVRAELFVACSASSGRASVDTDSKKKPLVSYE